jgi:cell division protein FtsW (lipid II flippase)
MYSSSSQLVYSAYRKAGTFYSPIVEHLRFLIIGIVLAWTCQWIPLKIIRFGGYLLLIVSIVLLIVTLISGQSANEASRWLTIFGYSLQPSEFAKLAVIIVVADLISRIKEKKTDEKRIFWIMIAIVAVVCLLIFPENLSTAAMLFAVTFIMMFVGQISWKYIFLVLGIIVFLLAFLVLLINVVPENHRPAFLKRASTWENRILNHGSDENKYVFGDIKVTKQLFITSNTPTGQTTVEIPNNQSIEAGSLVSVHLEVAVDREMWNIHIQDTLVAGTKYADVIAGYKHQNGTAYNESISDSAINFVFEHIAKGIYNFEYNLQTNATVALSNKSPDIYSAYVITDENRQSQRGKIAIAKGGLLGVGPGNSEQRNVLPGAFSDFIFAIIIEETGLALGLFIMLLYLVLLFRAGAIATQSRTVFLSVSCIGLALMIVVQAFVHMAVATGLGPITGQPLPLISRGGTSIIVTCIYFGIIFSATRSIKAEKTKEKLKSEEPVITIEEE